MSATETVCARCESPLDAGDIRCPLCGEAVPPQETQQLTQISVELLRCGSCGAAAEYDPSVQGLGCAFCDSSVKVERRTDPLEQTEHYLPFTVTPDQARKALGEWLSQQGFFRPSDLREKARVQEPRALWWVGWVFDANAWVSWTADSDLGSGRSSWAPHSGQLPIDFDDVVVSASRGLTAKETYQLTRHYRLGTRKPEPSGIEKTRATIEQFDVQRSQGRIRILEAVDLVAAERLQQGIIPGDRFRNIHTVAQLRGLTTARYAFPAYVLAYHYRDKLYRAVVSGQDASQVYGKTPLSLAKLIMLILMVLAVLAGVGIILAA